MGIIRGGGALRQSKAGVGDRNRACRLGVRHRLLIVVSRDGNRIFIRVPREA
jgi:hypothetical protein